MRLTLAALLAAAVAACASPASACGFLACNGDAVADDNYPPGTPTLPPHIRALVKARGRGLSLAGFYNDPSLALAAPSRADYDYAPPAPAYVQAPEPVYAPEPEPGFGPAPLDTGYEPEERGPRVIISPFGRRHGEDRRVARERRFHPRVY